MIDIVKILCYTVICLTIDLLADCSWVYLLASFPNHVDKVCNVFNSVMEIVYIIILPVIK